MIQRPLKKNFRTMNRTMAVAFIAQHVPGFKADPSFPKGCVLCVPQAKLFSVHAYCESSTAMVQSPNKDGGVVGSQLPVLLLYQPRRDDRILIYEINEPSRIPVFDNKSSVTWSVIDKCADAIYIVNLRTGECNVYLSTLQRNRGVASV